MTNKILLITGGTGSFGNAVLNRYLNSEYFSKIRIFSRDEKKQDDLRKRINNKNVKKNPTEMLPKLRLWA